MTARRAFAEDVRHDDGESHVDHLTRTHAREGVAPRLQRQVRPASLRVGLRALLRLDRGRHRGGPGSTSCGGSAVRARAGRRTTTQLLAGTRSGAVACGVGAEGAGRAARRRWGGKRVTRTGAGAGQSGGRAGAVAAVGGAATLAGLARRRRGATRRLADGETASVASASRTPSRATLRTRSARPATNAVTSTSICSSLCIASRASHNPSVVVNCRRYGGRSGWCESTSSTTLQRPIARVCDRSAIGCRPNRSRTSSLILRRRRWVRSVAIGAVRSVAIGCYQRRRLYADARFPPPQLSSPALAARRAGDPLRAAHGVRRPFAARR